VGFPTICTKIMNLKVATYAMPNPKYKMYNSLMTIC